MPITIQLATAHKKTNKVLHYDNRSLSLLLLDHHNIINRLLQRHAFLNEQLTVLEGLYNGLVCISA